MAAGYVQDSTRFLFGFGGVPPYALFRCVFHARPLQAGPRPWHLLYATRRVHDLKRGLDYVRSDQFPVLVDRGVRHREPPAGRVEGDILRKALRYCHVEKDAELEQIAVFVFFWGFVSGHLVGLHVGDYDAIQARLDVHNAFALYPPGYRLVVLFGR